MQHSDYRRPGSGFLDKPVSGAYLNFGSTMSGHLPIDLKAGPTDGTGYVKIPNGFYVNSNSYVEIMLNDRSVSLAWNDFIIDKSKTLILRPKFYFKHSPVMTLPDQNNDTLELPSVFLKDSKR